MKKSNSGQFRPGPDARRHRFTKDECSRGFWSAIFSIVERYPDAIRSDGKHIAFGFLKVAGRHNKEKSR